MRNTEEKIAELQRKIEKRYRTIAKHQMDIQTNYKYIEKFKNEIEALQGVKKC